MIFLSLPYMYENLDFNNKLKAAQVYHEAFFTKTSIEMCYGSLPFSYWNGDLNNNYSKQPLLEYRQIMEIFESSKIPFCIDCSNINLVAEDLYDVHQNVILDAGHNQGNYIEISDLGVYTFLKDEYSGYDFILSSNADFTHPLTAEIINAFIEQKFFYLINLPNRLKNNIEELNKIIDKNKIIIHIGERCKCGHLDKINYCKAQEQLNQINFSNRTMYNCQYMNTYNDNTELYNEIIHFQKLGFSHFRVEAPSLIRNREYQLYLIDNLIKPEYKVQVVAKTGVII